MFPKRRLLWRVREIVHLLLEYGAETRQELESAFCRAANGGRVEVVKMLMERSVDLLLMRTRQFVRLLRKGTLKS